MKDHDTYTWTRRKRFAYVLRRTRSLVGLLLRFVLASRGDERQQTYDRLCTFMLEAGGVYTKFLQGVLLGVPEVQDWVKRQNVDFFENVPTEPLDVPDILRAELGEQVERLQVSSEVLASGTFAQVYAGLLDSYQPVIVKIQRQTIRPSLKNDVWLLKHFARYGRRLLTSVDADITAISKDFTRMTLAEMDYKREARLAELMRQRVGTAHPEIVIPVTFTELSTEHIIIQQRLGGTSLAELLYREKPLTALERQSLQDTMTLILTLPFTTGLVHADPHPGNIRLLDDSRIALLDFGAVDDTPVEVDIYRRLLGAVIKAMDGTMTASEALDVYFATYAPRLYNAIEVTGRALGLPPILPMFAEFSMGNKQAGEPLSKFKGSILALADINKLVNPNNRFALRSSFHNVSYARAAHTIMQTMQLLELETEMISSLHSISQRMQTQPDLFTAPQASNLSVVEAKEIVYGWLEKVLQRNPLMAADLRDVFITMKRADRNQAQRAAAGRHS
ncbi:MAG TPA: AarF/ABC1/UbiB kinase family protein [Candidatus Saccharimonadales bacterium]|nr:AarF/ABC1/UbiB kinase family protein [Candidatus Saccharimonadales bacterium]